MLGMTPAPPIIARCLARAAIAMSVVPGSSSSAVAGAGDGTVTIVDLSRDLPQNIAAMAASPGSAAVRDVASGDPFLRAAVVLERGRVVAEYVRENVDPRVPFQVWSTTKSWTSLLIGIMADENLLSVDETLGEIFADEDDAWDDVADAATVDFRKAVTIEEMLTMTSGLILPPDFWDEGVVGEEVFEGILRSGGGSSLRDSLAYPAVGTAGEFSYLGISNILSYVIKERTGMTPREYLAQKVMAPLGIGEDEYGWRRNEEGVEFAFHGLELTPIQMAKFGQLYLQGGVVGPAGDGGDERRAVSRGWIDDTFAVRSVDYETGEAVGYGYLFWRDRSAFCALGMFGEDICVDRRSERVVVQLRDPDYDNIFEGNFVISPVALDPSLSFDAPSENINGDYRSAILTKVAGGIRMRPRIMAVASFVLGLSMLKGSTKLFGRSWRRAGYDAIQ